MAKDPGATRLAEPAAAGETRRSARKAGRRRQLLRAAAALIAERGFAGVRLEDLGAAAGISGPAVYRHFPGKEAVLTELLVGISEGLLEGGRAAVDAAATPEEAVAGLIDFQLDFAFGEPELIRIQDRDLASLPPGPLHQVRQAPRRDVETWGAGHFGARPGRAEVDAPGQDHAVLRPLTSTP